MGNDDCVALVVQPIMRDVLTIFKKLLQISDGGENVLFVTDGSTLKLAKALGAELVHVKLGEDLDLSDASLSNLSLSEALMELFVKNAMKVLSVQLKKLHGPAATMLKQDADAYKNSWPPANADSNAEKPQGVTGAVDEQAAGGAVPGESCVSNEVGQGTVDASITGEQKAGIPKAAAETKADAAVASDSNIGELTVGAIVITTSGNHKEKYDKKRAEVMKVAARTLVKFLEGPEEDNTKEFAKDKLTLEKGLSPLAKRPRLWSRPLALALTLMQLPRGQRRSMGNLGVRLWCRSGRIECEFLRAADLFWIPSFSDSLHQFGLAFDYHFLFDFRAPPAPFSGL